LGDYFVNFKCPAIYSIQIQLAFVVLAPQLVVEMFMKQLGALNCEQCAEMTATEI